MPVATRLAIGKLRGVQGGADRIGRLRGGVCRHRHLTLKAEAGRRKDGRPTVDNYTKNQLKKQDKFVTTTSNGLAWANENRKSTIVTASLLLAVILVLVGGFAWYGKRSDAASAALGSAMQTYNTPVASAARPVNPGQKSFPTLKDRATQANAEFLAVANQYGSMPDGKVARYFTGLTYMEAGQNQSAEDSLKTVAGYWNTDLSALGKLALAQLYVSEGHNDQAIALYKELGDGKATTVPAGLAQIQLAELYEASGKPDEAKKIYASLKDKDKDAKGKAGPVGALAAEKLNPKAAGEPAGL